MNQKLNKLLKKMYWKNTKNKWDIREIVLDVVIITAIIVVSASVWYRFYG